MIVALSTILTVFFTIPILGFLLVYLLEKVMTKDSKKSMQRAINYTTILFIISVHFLILTIWGKSLFWVMVLIMIVIAMVFVVVHWKVKGEIVLKKVMKGFWRFNFLFFFLVYLALTIYGLIYRALTFTFAT